MIKRSDAYYCLSRHEYVNVTNAARRGGHTEIKRAMQRRDFLRALAALTVAGLRFPGLFAAEPATTALSPLGKPQAFDYAWLKGQARALANGTYHPPVSHIPDEVKALDVDHYDQYQAIR